jgi:hypothetical protein
LALPLETFVVEISTVMTCGNRFFSKTELVQKYTISKWIKIPPPNIQYQKSEGFISEHHWDIMVGFL